MENSLYTEFTKQIRDDMRRLLSAKPFITRNQRIRFIQKQFDVSRVQAASVVQAFNMYEL